MQEPSAQSSGLINVAVPKETMARANGFSFPVPEQVHTGAGTAPNIRLSSGDPLPSWLRFNAQTKTFVATFVPAGGLPVHVVVAADGAESTIVISEMP